MKQGLSPDWIARLFEHPDLLRMGHHQRAEDQNLGMGWLYYAFGRMIRPRLAVVIGSWRGFVPLMIAKALQDNLESRRGGLHRSVPGGRFLEGRGPGE